VRSAIAAGVSGLLFGTGLGVSGMTKPAKVIGFLDLFGAWDPSLMFVMAGALAVHVVLGRVIRRRERPLLDTKFHDPEAKVVDTKLVVGATLFGMGWGIAGFCPGPALVTSASGASAAIVFVITMGVGMAVHHVTKA
jgi:uncharacterized protein